MFNTEIFRQPGRFAGWPANYGMWGFGEEVVCCFTVGSFGKTERSMHAVDQSKPFETRQSRSLDGSSAPGQCCHSGWARRFARPGSAPN